MSGRAGGSDGGVCTPMMLKDLALALPSQLIIACHFGGYHRLTEAREHILGLPVFLDTSWPPSLATIDPATVRELIRRQGANRIVFSPDWPTASPAAEVRAVHDLGLDDDETSAILGGNMADSRPRRRLKAGAPLLHPAHGPRHQLPVLLGPVLSGAFHVIAHRHFRRGGVSMTQSLDDALMGGNHDLHAVRGVLHAQRRAVRNRSQRLEKDPQDDAACGAGDREVEDLIFAEKEFVVVRMGEHHLDGPLEYLELRFGDPRGRQAGDDRLDRLPRPENVA